MQFKQLSSDPERVYAVLFEYSEEPISGLASFAKEQKLSASRITGIGAFENATVGFFEWHKKQYKRILIDEQAEVLSLIGDISIREDGDPEIHVHVVVGRADGSAHGGHLLEGRVRPTLEILITESPAYMNRKFDPESGIALIRFDDSP